MKTYRRQSKHIDPARAAVLKATNRPEDFQGISGQKEASSQAQCKPAAEVLAKLAEEFRKAAS